MLRVVLNHRLKPSANLHDANLRNANLRDADLHGANLHGAHLRDAYLRNADLRNADLHGANLSDAYLRNADLRGANLINANLRGANLYDVRLSSLLFSIRTEWGLLVALPDGTVFCGCQSFTLDTDWAALAEAYQSSSSAAYWSALQSAAREFYTTN